MSRFLAASLVVLTTSAIVLASSTITLLDEHFESGTMPPPNWTTETNLVQNDDAPAVFDAAGNGPDGAVVYGPKTPYAGMPAASKSAGYSTSLDPWDGSSPQWIEKEWHLAPGTYDVQLDFDRYTYYGGASTDFWSMGNRVYLLTDGDYAIDPRLWFRQGQQTPPGFDSNSPSSLSAYSFRRTHWVVGEVNGSWEHVTVSQPTTVTTTGNFVLRLLMHEKYSGQQSALWDNIVLHFKQGGQDVAGFPFTEDFEAGLDANGWTARSPYLLNNNDTPFLFTPTDVALYTNTDNPGSQSVGYSSNLGSADITSADWLQWQHPAAVPAGTYDIHLEFDRYVYELSEGNPWGVGNRVYLLTDDQYNQPHWNFDGGPPPAGLRLDYWSGDNSWALNGVWHHEVIDTTLTTTTGNIELRLLQHDKTTGPQAVAWDNVKLTIATPCNAPWADSNGDGFVDMLDFAILQTCLTSGLATPGTLSAECKCFDRPQQQQATKDGQITDQDVSEFVRCAAAPGIPWVQPTDCDTTP